MPKTWPKRSASRRHQDIATGTTTAGPHRDDWTLVLGQRPIVSFGSGGEFRSAVMAWRQAESAQLAERTNLVPITLLDDVFSELDEFRRESLMRNLPDGQTVITTPSSEPLPPALQKESTVIKIGPEQGARV